MKEKIWFIINPISGVKRKDQIPMLIQSHLDHEQFDYEILFTEHRGHAVDLAKDAIEKKIDIVCAVGGDGSVHEVGTTLIGSDVKLAIIPMGSGNGLARHMKIPTQTIDAILRINLNQSISMDTVRINDTPILGVGGYGFDALIAKKFDENKKRGFLNYIKLVAKEFIKYNPINITIDANGKVRKLPVVMCTIANTSEFGNGFVVSPKSDATDGEFELVILKPFSFWRIPTLVFQFFTKRADQSNFTEIIKTNKATLKISGKIAHFDGEPGISKKEINIQLIPKSLKIVV